MDFAPGYGKDPVLDAVTGLDVASEFDNEAKFRVANNAMNLREVFWMEFGVEQLQWTDSGIEKESLENVFLPVVEDDIVSV